MELEEEFFYNQNQKIHSQAGFTSQDNLGSYSTVERITFQNGMKSQSLNCNSDSSLIVLDKYDHIYQQYIDLQYEDDEKYNSEETERTVCVQQAVNLGLVGIDRMKLWTGLTLMGDGTLRLCASLGAVSFNYQQQIVDCVEDKKNLGVVDLHFTKNYMIKESSIDEALNYLNKIENIKYKDIEFELKRFGIYTQSLKKSVSEIDFTTSQLDEKDEQFQQHIQFCYDYLNKNYNSNPENSVQMYWYQIGRINFRQKDIEILRQGYSKSYLELIGLNQSSLNTIYLRRQQVDLIKDRCNIIRQTLAGLDAKFNSIDDDQQIIFPTTFDGYPLTLTQRKISVKCPFVSDQKEIKEYFFSILEIDVDLDQLQRLIEYRQKLLSYPNNLSIDEFIQKELSYQFEDVEYSIHSLSFMEKFYEDNLAKIRFLEQQLIKKQEEQKSCGYKLIHKKNLFTIASV